MTLKRILLPLNLTDDEAAEELERRMRPLMYQSDFEGMEEIYSVISVAAQWDNKADMSSVRSKLREKAREVLRRLRKGVAQISLDNVYKSEYFD